MLSISFLFERRAEDPIQQVVSPTAERDSYVKQKRYQLRSMLGRPGQNSTEIHQQLKDLERNKNNPGWGVTLY
jgi:hypothetical protein